MVRSAMRRPAAERLVPAAAGHEAGGAEAEQGEAGGLGDHRDALDDELVFGEADGADGHGCARGEVDGGKNRPTAWPDTRGQVGDARSRRDVESADRRRVDAD